MMRRKITGRGWVFYGIFLMVFAAGGVYFASRWLPSTAQASIERALSRFGISMEAREMSVGWGIAHTGAVRARMEGIEVGMERVSATWSPVGLAEGRVEVLRLEGVDARVDLERWWPVPAEAHREVPAAQPHSPTATRVEDDGWGSADFPGPEAAVGPEPLEMEPTASPDLLPSQAPALPWWRNLPFTALHVPEARVEAVYGEARIPLRASLSYMDAELKREGRLAVEGEGLELALNARELDGTTGWTAQGALSWADPVGRLEAFLPPGHPAHPSVLGRFGLRHLDLEGVQAEGVVRGGEGELTEIGFLLEGGKADLRWKEGAAVLSNWILAGSGAVGAMELNGGLSVIDWHHDALRASDFQAVIRRDRTGLVEAEVPRLSWRHESGWSGTLALRTFARVSPHLPGRAGAEAQLAFSEFRGPFVGELAPFRLFVKETAEGGQALLSALETSAFPEWALVHSTVNVVRSSDLDEHYQFSAELEFLPTSESVLKLEGEAVSAPGGWRLTGRLETPEKLPVARLSGVELGGNRPRMEAAETLELDEFLPWLTKRFPGLRDWTGNGRVHWRAVGRRATQTSFFTSWEVAAALDLEAVDLATQEWALDGLTGSLRLQAFPFVRAAGEQQLAAAAVRFANGDEWREPRMRFTWPMRDRMRITDFSATWGSVGVHIGPFAFDPRSPRFGVRLTLEALEAAQLPPSMRDAEAAREARYRAVFMLDFEGGEWRCRSLEIHSSAGRRVGRHLPPGGTFASPAATARAAGILP